MTRLEILRDRVGDLGDNIDLLMAEAVKDAEEEILGLNTEDQMYKKGVTAEGEKITPGYTEGTKAIKKAKGQPTDRVTLRDTGDFHESVFVDAEEKGLRFGADDPKAEKLYKKYGSDVIGLTADNIKRAGALLVPGLIRGIKKRLLK